MKSFKFLFVFCVCLLLISGVPAQKASIAGKTPNPEQQGPYEIGFSFFMLTDASRGDRPIPVYVWYPADPEDIDGSTPEAVIPLDPIFNVAGPTLSSNWEAYGADPAYQEPPVSADSPFPLVVFSPGWGGPAWGHLFIAARLASHGFVVAVAYHYGDAFFPWEGPFDHLAIACMNRPRDISYMLTGLLTRNDTPGEVLYDAIRPYQVAASGWSLGGYASMTLAGGDDSVCDIFQGDPTLEPIPPETCVPSPPDPRIKLILPLDGSNQVLWFEELARISVPTMGMGQEWSTLEALGFASWQALQHAAIQGHPCYRVDVADADHQAFCNLCEGADVLFDIGLFDAATRDWFKGFVCAAAIPRTEVNRLLSKYMVAFLKKYLAHEQGYKKILTPGHAHKEPYIEFFVTEKRNPNSIDEDWPDDFVYHKHQPGSDQAKAEKNPEKIKPVKHMGIPR